MPLTAEQLEIRKTGVTSTDAPAILNLSPFRSPLDVWRDKRGQGPVIPDTYHLQRGRFFEPGMRDWYAEEVGASRVDLPGTVVSRWNKLVIATPDGVPYVKDETRALEIKVPAFAHGDWGTEGTDQIPSHYHVQAHWHLLALDLERCDVAALLNGKLCLYTVQRDLELEGILLERTQKFWTDHVLGDTPPAATGLDDSYLRELYGKDNGLVLTADELPADVREALPELFAMHQAKATTEKRYKDLSALVQQAMGPASLLECELGRISWQTNKTGGTDWKGLAELLLEGREDRAQLLQQFARPGARPFTPKARKAA
jgi:putative phage-type endonuclease